MKSTQTESIATSEDMVIVAMINESYNVKKAYRKFQVSSIVGMTTEEYLTKRNRLLGAVRCFEENIESLSSKRVHLIEKLKAGTG